MKTRVQKWGNSLALRIPKAFAEEAGLAPDAQVELSLIDGQLVIEPVKPAITLEGLVAQITDENIHGEVDSGSPVGNEIW